MQTFKPIQIGDFVESHGGVYFVVGIAIEIDDSFVCVKKLPDQPWFLPGPAYRSLKDYYSGKNFFPGINADSCVIHRGNITKVIPLCIDQDPHADL